MRRLGLSYALLMVSVSTQAVLAGTGTVTVKDQAGATQTYVVTTTVGGQYLPATTLCDGVAGATCVTVGTYGTAPGAVAAMNVNAFMSNLPTVGQKASAASLPVVISSDQMPAAGSPSLTNVMTVQGATGMTPIATTFSGTVSAAQSGTWNMRLQDGGGNGISSDLRGTERTLSVQIIDAAGNQVTSFGGTGAVTQSGVWTQRLQDGSGNAITSDLRGSARPLAVEIIDSGGAQITAFNGGAVTQSGNWSQRLQDGSGNPITSATRGAQQPLSVQVVDAAGNQITNFSGSGAVTQSGTWSMRLQDSLGNGITSSARGGQQPLSVQILDALGNQVTNFAGSTTGFPGTQTTGSPITATTGGVIGSLPTGTTVVATNVGSTNAAYCKLGTSVSTNDQYIAPNGGWFAFTVGSNTTIACATSTSTTQVNLVGGSGLPTGTGGGSGGSGGGGGGAIGTYGTNPGAVAAQAVNANVTNLVSLGQVNNSLSTPVTISTDQMKSAGAPSTTQVMTVQGVSGGTSMNMAVTNLNGNGQALMVNSTPVVIASDQAYLGTTAGWTIKILNGLTNTPTAVKTSGGQLGKLYCANPNTSFAYIQVYNTLAGSVTPGTTVPAQSYGIPPTNAAGFAMALVGDQYGAAITVAATTTVTGGSAPSIALDCNVSYN